MKIAVRKEPNGLIYIDKNIYYNNRFDEQTLAQPPYNYIKVELEEQYSNCVSSDFNDDLVFNIEKYNLRKQKANAQQEIINLKEKLRETDCQAIKFAEGEMTAEEFEPLKQKRKNWRRKINELEGNL